MKPTHRLLASALIGAAITLTGVMAYAHGTSQGPHSQSPRHGNALSVMQSPAQIAQRSGTLLEHIYSVSLANENQKTQLAALASLAARDLNALQAPFETNEKRLIELLCNDPVDRAAIDALQQEQTQVMAQTAQRYTFFLTEIAEHLTPEQRQRFAVRHPQHSR